MNENNYTSVDDFLEDESFRNWVQRIDPSDAARWEQWLEEHPSRKELASEAAMMLQGITFQPRALPRHQVESALQHLNREIDRQSQRKLGFIRRPSYWPVAATVALLITAIAVVSWFFRVGEVVYHTAYGEQLDLKLADGTVVTLNANSTLRLFPNHTREVWLEGEAFFEVESKPVTGAKFLVHTEDLEIEVLGTAFNVSRRSDQTQVVLEEGKVQLHLKNGDQKTMNPGDLVSYSASSDRVIASKNKVRLELHTTWKDGTLIFQDNITLEEAMWKIEDIYGWQSTFLEETLANRKITASIPTKNLDLCITAFEKALGITIEKAENNQLIIKSR